MIKFLITHKETGRDIFGLVITDRNVELLKQDKPLHFNAEDLGMKDITFNELMLIYYPDNETAIKDLTEKGYITPETKIRDIKVTKQ